MGEEQLLYSNWVHMPAFNMKVGQKILQVFHELQPSFCPCHYKMSHEKAHLIHTSLLVVN